jgi:hypothetical protein
LHALSIFGGKVQYHFNDNKDEEDQDEEDKDEEEWPELTLSDTPLR